MTSRLTKALVGVGTAAAALTLGMSSAAAAPTYTVTAGDAPVGTSVQISGITQGVDPDITFVDSSTGTVLNCDSGTAPGVTKTGTNKPGTKIGTINGAGTKWNNCTGPLGLQLAVTGVGTWNINATGTGSTSVLGNISNVTANVAQIGGGCSFTVTGSVPIKLINTNSVLQVLSTQSNLVLSNVTAASCFGLVNNGDHANFAAKYKLKAKTASYNPIKITSP